MDSAVPLPLELGGATKGDDKALIQAAQRDPIAFGELYKRYLARVYGYLRARAPTDEDAADLAEQVFLQAFKALPRYQQHGAPFVAWLLRIARNVATDAHRRSRTTVPWEVVPETEHPIDEQSPEAVVVRREQILRVRALLAQLPDDQREVVLLRFAAGLTLREIGLVVGKGESTVHQQLSAALELLKERCREA